MEKRILFAISAALACIGQVQANATLINAATRFMMTGAGIGGASLYAAEKYPGAYDRVNLMLHGSATQTPVPPTSVAPSIDPNALLLNTQIEAITKALEGPSLARETAPFLIKIGAIGLAGFLVWDFTCGNGYTRKLVKTVEKKLKTLSENAQQAFHLLNDKIKVLYKMARKAEKDNQETKLEVGECRKDIREHGQELETIHKKVDAILKVNTAISKDEQRKIAKAGLNIKTNLVPREAPKTVVLEEQDGYAKLMEQTINFKTAETEENQDQQENTDFWGKCKAFAGWFSRT